MGEERRKEREKRKREKKERKGKEKEKGKGKRKKMRKRKVDELLHQISGIPMIGTRGPRSKVCLCDEGYTWVSKLRSFTEYPTKEIRKIPSTTLQEVRIFPTLVYFLL